MNVKLKPGQSGFTLIEALVYMAVLFVIVGMAYTAMYRSMNASAGLRRNANDIESALKAGERWREDVREAVRPPRVENVGHNETILHLPQARGEVSYRFSDNRVSRRSGQSEWFALLENVKVSTFIADQRSKVTAWRWEVELRPYRKRISSIPPLFTFISVPSANSSQ